MSLLSSIILPRLGKELIALKPQVVKFCIEQLVSVGSDVLGWARKK